MRDYRRSIRLYEESRQYLAGGVSSNFRYGSKPVPLFFARGEGARLIDVDGNTYIDYALGNGPVILGHSPRAVLQAVADALGDGQLYAAQHERELALAKALTRIIPCAELVRFSLSGSEAVQAVLRLARAYTGRSKIIKFEGHYHGWFDNVLISVRPPVDAAGPYREPCAVPGTPGQVQSALGDVIVIPWNDLDVLANAIRHHGAQVAGIIMEPIMYNTGAVLPVPGYLEGVRELCARNGSVLIFDEVITGFRVGLGGAQALFGVTPDLAVFAKALAGGFPMSCLAGRHEIMTLLETPGVLHGGTYNSNVASIAAGLATIRELERNSGDVFRQIEAIGKQLMDGLRDLSQRHRQPLLVQGVEAAFHTAFAHEPITDYRTYCQSDLDPLQRFVELLQHAGVRTTGRGLWFLSSAHSRSDVEETLKAADWALRELG